MMRLRSSFRAEPWPHPTSNSETAPKHQRQKEIIGIELGGTIRHNQMPAERSGARTAVSPGIRDVAASRGDAASFKLTGPDADIGVG